VVAARNGGPDDARLNADLIFQVISRRYEKKSLVLTTNLAFADWHTIFPSATCATALVERVVHHADIAKIEGESYRLRESQVDATTRSKSRRDKKASAYRAQSLHELVPGGGSTVRNGRRASVGLAVHVIRPAL
jgi:IstB-like ATP binding protein